MFGKKFDGAESAKVQIGTLGHKNARTFSKEVNPFVCKVSCATVGS